MQFNQLKENLLKTNTVIDNEYLDKYIQLILDNIDTEYIAKSTQSHHIIPQYYFEMNNLKVNNDESNLVNLLYKYHLLAHYYLAKCSIANCISKNVLSIRFLLNGKTLDNFEISDDILNDYQLLYEKSRQDIYEKTHSVSANKKISEKLMGRVSPNLGNIKEKKPRKSNKNPNAKNKKLSDLACQRTGEKNSFYGKHHTEHSKALLAQAHNIPVGMYNLETKELIKSFESIKQAAQYLIDNNITTSSAAESRICAVCKLNTDYNRAYGFNWRYLNKV